MEIPHTVKPHPVTGLPNPKLGIWLFLASEVMLFGALFSSYVLLRVGSDTWLPHGAAHPRDILNVPLAALNTAFLISSSVSIVFAWTSLKLGNVKRFKIGLWTTFLFGVGFMIIKSIEYGTKFNAGHFPSTANFYAVYFTLTGLHGLHVLGGMIAMFFMGTYGLRMLKTNPEQYTNRIEYVGLYWHFVDLVWIFLFPSIYLL